MKRLFILFTALILILMLTLPAPANMLGAAGKRPQYWWDLGQNDDSALGGLTGTHVRASDATYRDPDNSNQITTATTNIPRFESVGGHRAILLEPGSTNLITDSEDFSAWTTSDVSIAADVTGPDGVANGATTITDDDVAGDDYIKLAVNPATDDEKYTASFFVKEGTSADFTIIVQDTGTPGTRAEIDFEWSAGDLTVKAEDTGTGAVEQVADTSWWRAIVCVPVNVIVEAQAHEIQFYPTENGRQAAETTIVWGVQFEEFAVATSYIVTASGTASRATESGYPLWTLPAGLFDALGMCSVWWRPGFASTDGNLGGTIVGVHDVDISSLVYVYSAGGLGQIRSHDETTVALNALNWVANTWYKLVVKWGYDVGGNEKFRVGVDSGAGIVWGVEQNFDGSYSLRASLRLALGLFGPMWMRDLRLYDRILTDTEIDSLGSP